MLLPHSVMYVRQKRDGKRRWRMFCGILVFGESANEATRLGCGRKTTDARVVEGRFIFLHFSLFFPACFRVAVEVACWVRHVAEENAIFCKKSTIQIYS